MRALLLIAALGACGVDPPHATTLDAQRSNIALDQLHEGRRVMIEKCAGCHRAPLPSDVSATEWPLKIEEMSERSKLDGRQRKLIEQYLVVMATRSGAQSASR